MKTLLVSFIVFSAFCAKSQSTQPAQKIGHADWEYIFSQMPEYKQIEIELRTFEGQLQNQLKLKSQELDTKYKAYKAIADNTPEAIKKDKESELAYLQDNLQKFQQDAQVSMQKKQSDLVNPVFAKVGKAIEEVAVENGFAYIINPQVIGGGDVLLFTDEKYNISDLVLKNLGVDITNSKTSPAKKD